MKGEKRNRERGRERERERKKNKERQRKKDKERKRERERENGERENGEEIKWKIVRDKECKAGRMFYNGFTSFISKKFSYSFCIICYIKEVITPNDGKN